MPQNFGDRAPVLFRHWGEKELGFGAGDQLTMVAFGIGSELKVVMD